jgi:hypothetical protein
VSLDGVMDGRHPYTTTATDAAGNESAASAERVVWVDTGAPLTEFDAVPPALTAERRPTVRFTLSEPGAEAECRLDGPGAVTGTYAPCASPLALGPLTDGRYVLLVRASDAAGNTGPPVSATFAIDATAPRVTVGGAVSGRTVTWTFGASEPSARFECRLGVAAFAPCASPLVLGGLADGDHTLSVRATDPAGNVSAVAARTVTVSATPPLTPPALPPPGQVFEPVAPPVLTLGVSRQSLATVLRRGLTVRVGCAPACRATVVVAAGRRVAARRTGAVGSVRLTLSRAARRTLARMRRVKLTVTVSAPGARTVTRRITLRRARDRA